MPAIGSIGTVELLVLAAVLAVPIIVGVGALGYLLWVRQRHRLARSGPLDAVPADPWLLLRAGMTEAEVTRILGRPTQVETSGTTADWHYRLGAREATVAFAEGKLVGFRKPDA
jgi:hypothetical protein